MKVLKLFEPVKYYTSVSSNFLLAAFVIWKVASLVATVHIIAEGSIVLLVGLVMMDTNLEYATFQYILPLCKWNDIQQGTLGGYWKPVHKAIRLPSQKLLISDTFKDL